MIRIVPSCAGLGPKRTETIGTFGLYSQTPGGSVASPQSGQSMFPSCVAGALQMNAFLLPHSWSSHLKFGSPVHMLAQLEYAMLSG